MGPMIRQAAQSKEEGWIGEGGGHYNQNASSTMVLCPARKVTMAQDCPETREGRSELSWFTLALYVVYKP